MPGHIPRTLLSKSGMPELSQRLKWTDPFVLLSQRQWHGWQVCWLWAQVAQAGLCDVMRAEMGPHVWRQFRRHALADLAPDGCQWSRRDG